MANIFQQGRKKGRDLRPGWRVVALFGCEIVVVRRRQWTPEAKAGQMAEVESVSGLVSVVAQRHVFSKGLLYNWRSGRGRRAAADAHDTHRLHGGGRSGRISRAVGAESCCCPACCAVVIAEAT